MHACKEYVKTHDALAVGILFNISLEWSKKVYYRLWTADDVIHSFIHMFDSAGCKPMMAWLWTTCELLTSWLRLCISPTPQLPTLYYPYPLSAM